MPVRHHSHFIMYRVGIVMLAQMFSDKFVLRAVSIRLYKKKKLAVELVEQSREAVYQEKLVTDERPVGNGAVCPLLLQFNDSQIKQFENGIDIGKCAALCHFAKTGINRLNRICRVHNFAHRRRIIKKLFDVGFRSVSRRQSHRDIYSRPGRNARIQPGLL